MIYYCHGFNRLQRIPQFFLPRTGRGSVLRDVSLIWVIRVKCLGSASVLPALLFWLLPSTYMILRSTRIRHSASHHSGLSHGMSPRFALLVGPLPGKLLPCSPLHAFEKPQRSNVVERGLQSSHSVSAGSRGHYSGGSSDH